MLFTHRTSKLVVIEFIIFLKQKCKLAVWCWTLRYIFLCLKDIFQLELIEFLKSLKIKKIFNIKLTYLLFALGFRALDRKFWLINLALHKLFKAFSVKNMFAKFKWKHFVFSQLFKTDLADGPFQRIFFVRLPNYVVYHFKFFLFFLLHLHDKIYRFLLFNLSLIVLFELLKCQLLFENFIFAENHLIRLLFFYVKTIYRLVLRILILVNYLIKSWSIKYLRLLYVIQRWILL